SGKKTNPAADALREDHKDEDLATPQAYALNPPLLQDIYNKRRRQLQQPQVQPKAPHLALADQEAPQGDQFQLVTQKIENQHERAGN
ncbi:NAD-dependent protein deacylase, partial [Erwinia amylovora]|uniref:Sir2 family NAD-dependent protein deacetylase n=1 Tax=Erwinia amylovora TaxID=552 RepID=UPI00295E4C2E